MATSSIAPPVVLFLCLRRGPFLRPGLRAAQGSRWTGRHRIGFDAREGAPLVEYRPRDAGALPVICLCGLMATYMTMSAMSRRRRPPCRSDTAADSQVGPPPDLATTSAVIRRRRVDFGRQCEKSADLIDDAGALAHQALPDPVQRLQVELVAKIPLRILSKPLLTRDQVELLRYDNVVSDTERRDGLTLEELGIAPQSITAIVPTYLWRFRKAGQFRGHLA